MGKRHESILSTIGNTPVVRINKLGPAGVNLYAKIESFNPMGSVKDRLALGVIEDAERRGELRRGQTIVEATSGNTGIGLAMVCAQKGYPLVVTMAESFSLERRKLLRFLGAKVVLTPAAEKGTGMLNKAIELAEEHGWYLCRQFENSASRAASRRPIRASGSLRPSPTTRRCSAAASPSPATPTAGPAQATPISART
jgi:cysteine synthase A